jgi:hypothetical protein
LDEGEENMVKKQEGMLFNPMLLVSELAHAMKKGAAWFNNMQRTE